MNTNTTTNNATSPADTSRFNKGVVGALAIGLGLLGGAGAFLLSGGDDAAEGETTTAPAAEIIEESAPDPAPAEVEESTDDPAPAEDDAAPDDDASDGAADVEVEESNDRPEVPTIVVGQDEDGNDIVVELEIAGVCAQTFHEPLDANSFSFIRWTYEAPGLEPGQPVKVFTAGFEHFTVVTPDYKVVFEQGITSYGEYPFPSIEWNVDADTKSSIAIDDSHTVDDTEGEASETCIEEES